MIKPNRKRRDAAYARNFGDEADTIRACLCLVRGCNHPAQAAHVIPRGMGSVGGGRFDLVPLCQQHHAEAGEGRSDGRPTSQRAAFQERYRLDLREAADRIAVEHSPPNGHRGSMQVWLDHRLAPHLVDALTKYERDALFGWARRWADRAMVRLADQCETSILRPAITMRDAPGHACMSVARALEVDLADAVALLEAAGWRATS